jgi:hypothetical protein
MRKLREAEILALRRARGSTGVDVGDIGTLLETEDEAAYDGLIFACPGMFDSTEALVSALSDIGNAYLDLMGSFSALSAFPTDGTVSTSQGGGPVTPHNTTGDFYEDLLDIKWWFTDVMVPTVGGWDLTSTA